MIANTSVIEMLIANTSSAARNFPNSDAGQADRSGQQRLIGLLPFVFTEQPHGQHRQHEKKQEWKTGFQTRR